jgi:hypothetical protein
MLSAVHGRCMQVRINLLVFQSRVLSAHSHRQEGPFTVRIPNAHTAG